MKPILKWGGRGLLAILILIALLALWKREQITRLLAVNSLFNEDKIVHNFSHMDEAFLSAELDRGAGPVSVLEPGTQIALPDAAAQWIIDRNVTALVVLKGGKLAHESYYLGTGEMDMHISWSVAKSYLSALMGIIVEEGLIDISQPVTLYAPELAGSAYEGATVQDVLRMSSGVKFNEDYLDFNSDINKMGRTLGLGGSMDGFAAGLTERERAPGGAWQYVSIDTHVLGMVIRGATGRSIKELLAEKIIAKLGLERAPYYVTDGYGVAFVLGGLNLTTRDYARFGQMIANGGQWQGEQVVPAAWIRESTLPSAKTPEGAIKYGYQWWIPADAGAGEFLARGIYGQYIYVNGDTVVALNSADRKFREPGVFESNLEIFRALAAQ